MLRAWQRFAAHEKAERKAVRHADGFHRATVLLSSLRTWERAIQNKRACAAAATAVEQAGARRAKTRAWGVWRTALAARREEREALSKAAAARDSVLAQTAFAAWRRYVLFRRQKAALCAKADAARNSRLLKQAVRTWHRKLLRNRRIAEVAPVVEDRWKRALMQRQVDRWRLFAAGRILKRLVWRQAEEVRERTLKQQGWNQLKCAFAEKRAYDQACAIADAHNERRLLRMCFGARGWVGYCDAAEEARLAPKTTLARAHANTVRIRNAVARWRAWTDAAVKHRRLCNRADRHRKDALRRNAIKRWGSFVALQLRKRWLAQQASEFSRRALLNVCFQRWRQSYARKVHYSAVDQTADDYYNARMVAVAFAKWRWSMVASQQSTLRMAEAAQHRRRNLATRALQAWRAWVRNQKEKNRLVATANEHAATSAARRAWRQWKRRVDAARQAVADEAVASAHCTAALVKSAWRRWRNAAVAGQNRRTAAALALAASEAAVARRAFAAWRQVITSRRNEAIATKHRNTVLLRTAFAALVASKDAAKERSSEFFVLEVDFALKQDARRVAKAFAVWVDARVRSVRARKQMAAAAEHADSSLMRRALRGWDEQARLSALKARRHRKATQFRDFSLISSAFAQWKNVLLGRRIDDDKRSVALLFWSLRLKQKALLAWKAHAMKMKEQAERRQLALDNRRQWLVRSAVEQWIKASSAMTLRTSTVTLHREQQHAAALHARVRRFAEHWRRIASGGKRGHLSPVACIDTSGGSSADNHNLLPQRQRAQPRRRVSSAVEEQHAAIQSPALRGGGEKVAIPTALQPPSLAEAPSREPWTLQRRARPPPRRPREMLLELDAATLNGVPVPAGMRAAAPALLQAATDRAMPGDRAGGWVEPERAPAAPAEVTLAEIQQTLGTYALKKAEQQQLHADIQAAAARLADAGSGPADHDGSSGAGGSNVTAPHGTSAAAAAAAELARLVGMQTAVDAAAAEARAAAETAQHALKDLLAAC